MLCCNKNKKINESTITIFSLNLRLTNSSNHDDKINEIENILNQDYDIICFQRIDNDKSLNDIAKIINKYNLLILIKNKYIKYYFNNFFIYNIIEIIII